MFNQLFLNFLSAANMLKSANRNIGKPLTATSASCLTVIALVIFYLYYVFGKKFDQKHHI
ncbi:hypothetical protein WR164_00910 [Philodulcilactobacillus myokoensis]|uniref:Uncharacterized protein n=1 Tax=Philodulcilactobacillus myokoensis TaxID=2929573 RepID=A0A9W6AYD7_9LACO|nr:hypothetical protein [Philodulcilactobacillus myokoensis]GLB46112.1 hypothetical protein WR164_00910 [Philodulcilactobacillus myokoensis]